MSVYFPRGPKQENAGPIIQVHSQRSSFNSPVGAVNYQGKKASPNNWIDITTITINKKSNNSIMHLSIKGDCQANTNGNQRGAPGIRVSRDSGSGNSDDATTVIDLGAAQPSLDPNYDSVSFSHFFMDQGVPAGACRYRLQLQCNRAAGNDNNVQINANAQASLEVIEAGDGPSGV